MAALPLGVVGNAAAVPALAENESDRVRALAQRPRHVIGLVFDARVIVGPARSQPLVADGNVYVTASYGRLFAVDARTGEEKWAYTAQPAAGVVPCCSGRNRGAAIDLDKIYLTTLDAQLQAVDRSSGKLVWRSRMRDPATGYANFAAPLIVRGKVVVADAGNGQDLVGEVRAYDPETGEELWARPTVEGWAGRLDGRESTLTGTLNASWPGESWRRGGGLVPLSPTYDPALDLLFVGVGSPSPANAWLRPGANLQTSATLAIAPDTGAIVWGFQGTPNDAWGFGGANEAVPFELTQDGTTMKALAKADTNGFFFVLDRSTGRLLSARPFVDRVSWASGYDADGRPVETTDSRPPEPGEAGPTSAPAVQVSPAWLGAKSWMPMAYSERTGLFYVPANEWGMDLWYDPVVDLDGTPVAGAGSHVKPLDPQSVGVLRAIDPVTGARKWEYRNRGPIWGGVLATAGGLVFVGTPEGYLLALDDETGKLLWKFNTGSAVLGPPITWELDGAQYIAVVSGWDGPPAVWGDAVAATVSRTNAGGALWAFRLMPN